MLPVDLKLSIMKPLGAQWMIKQYNYLKSKPDIVQNGFKGSGITDSLRSRCIMHFAFLLFVQLFIYIYIYHVSMQNQ